MASDSELDLAALAAGAERDPTIEWLIDLAETGFALPVTLVVGGFLITGAPVRDEHWGAAIDGQVERVLGVAEEHYRRSPEGRMPDNEAAAFAMLRSNRLTDALQRVREERARRRAEIEGHIAEGGDEFDPKDLPGDLAVQWARDRSRDRFLTLTGASILIPPGRREEVGTVRVDIERIGAWWPAQFETAEQAAAAEGATAETGGAVEVDADAEVEPGS